MLGDTVSIPAGVTKVVIKIKALKGSTGVGTVKLILAPGADYTIGGPQVAKVKVVKKP